MDKVFRVKPALTEIASMSFKLPANMDECTAYLNGYGHKMTGREILITPTQPEYLTEEYEYKFMATEFGVIVEDVTNSAEYLMTIKESKIHNDIAPNIANKLTVEDVDRFLFDHPLEPAIEAMLIKHGYITKIALKDIAVIADENDGLSLNSSQAAGASSDFSGAESQNQNATQTAGLADSANAKNPDGQIVAKPLSPFKKQAIEA